MGKTTGSSTPSTQNVVQSSLPPELLPYAKDILNQGENLSNQPYVNYAGQRQADVATPTQQAYNQAGQLGQVGSGALGQAQTDLSGAAGVAQQVQGAGQAQIQQNQTYNPNQYNYDPTQAAPQINAQQYGYNGVNTPQVSGVGNVNSQSWAQPGVAQQYMSPYLSNVLSQQLNLANTQFGEQQNQRNSSAISQGAFGGDRAGLVNEAAQRDFNNSQNQMVAGALNSAYTTGQQAFNANNAQNLQAQQANQSAGLTTQGANLNAALNTNQLNQQGQLQTQALNSGNINSANQLNSSNYNAANALNAQYGFNTNQLNSQNANTADALNSSNLNTQNQLNSSNYNQMMQNLLQSGNLQNSTAAAQGQLGQTQQNMASTGLNALYAAGQSQQNYQQQGLDVGYNNFINQQQYPDQQLNFLSGLMHGFNVSPNSYTTTQSSFQNPVTQLVGAGTGLAGIASALGKGG